MSAHHYIAGAALGSVLGLLGYRLLSSPRSRVVRAALGELGKRDANKYWANVDPALSNTSASWCGGFALWCLHQAGLGCSIQWITNEGFLFRLHAIPVDQAQPGDIAYYSHNQHHAIIVKNNGDGSVLEVNGNGKNATVTQNTSRPDYVYSIQSLLPGRRIAC